MEQVEFLLLGVSLIISWSRASTQQVNPLLSGCASAVTAQVSHLKKELLMLRHKRRPMWGLVHLNPFWIGSFYPQSKARSNGDAAQRTSRLNWGSTKTKQKTSKHTWWHFSRRTAPHIRVPEEKRTVTVLMGTLQSVLHPRLRAEGGSCRKR